MAVQEGFFPAPSFSLQDAIRIASEHFKLEIADISFLNGYDDQNFLLTTRDGIRYVLKIYNLYKTDCGCLELQNQELDILSQTNFPCPRVIRNKRQEPITLIPSEDPQLKYHIRMLSFIPGKMFADVPHTPALLQQLGTQLARLDLALQAHPALSSLPAASRVLDWDMRHCLKTINGFIDDVTDPDRRSLLDRYLNYYINHVQPRLDELRTGLIHGDLNDLNLVVNDAGDEIIGILDFGDSIHSHLINDLAICLGYMMLEKEDPVTAASHIVSAFHQVLPLQPLEFEVLFPLACMRICTSVVYSAHAQKLQPDNEYLKTTEKPGWNFLRRVADVSAEQATSMFRAACNCL
eukprot:TRINITY_DN2957_c0_g2_i2.p1 TRINITY_DN2957_c0_g2~~TRINITY_DN2957_c0_g2_i2.p1  ORF type:complete len:372 (+),score=56.78 TRINITY_DN2957_c0_g2_i2:68-1117(+)